MTNTIGIPITQAKGTERAQDETKMIQAKNGRHQLAKNRKKAVICNQRVMIWAGATNVCQVSIEYPRATTTVRRQYSNGGCEVEEEEEEEEEKEEGEGEAGEDAEGKRAGRS